MSDYENPLPPPSRSADSRAGQALSNADFRKLLETPRADRSGETPRSRGKSAVDHQSGEFKKPKPRKPQRTKEAEATEEGEDDLPKYRDRAAERRQGLNYDYENVNADFASLMAGQGLDAQLRHISVEDSKFLGGDVEHTHLVKGLDFALLQKTRGDLRKDVGYKGDTTKPKAAVPASEGSSKFVTPLGRSVYNSLFAAGRVDVSSLFLPGRTSFVYELEDVYSGDTPTTLHRSKADCPQYEERLLGAVDSSVLERLAKIMSYMRVTTGKGGKKLNKKEKLRILEQFGLVTHGSAKPQGPPINGGGTADGTRGPLRPVDEDEDIFAPAGNTSAAPATQSRPLNSQPLGKAGRSYFDSADDMSDLPPLPSGPPPGERHASGAVVGDDDMEVDDGELPPPPPPPGPPGPPRAPPGYNYSAAYADAEAFVASNVAYQASTDPDYQALLAHQAQLRGGAAAAAAAGKGLDMSQQDKDAGLASVFRRDDEQLGQRRERDAREKDPAFVSDAYAECYPGYYEYATVLLDSDDEDYTQMDGKEKGMSRYDFNTEEEWQTYKQSKEANPKAAYQFGVKVSDGRKQHKDLGKSRDAKLNSQLSKIQKLMGNKYGNAHSAAFEKNGGGRPAEDTPGAWVQRNKRLKL